MKQNLKCALQLYCIAVHFLVDIIFHLFKYSIPCECYEKYSQQSASDLLTLANAIYQYLLFGQNIFNWSIEN